MEKKTITDLDEFQEFMEDGAIEAWKYETLKGYGPEAIPGYECIFLDYGNDGMTDEVLLPPAFEMDEITDEDGAVLCEYVSHPGFVRSVRWDVDAGTGEVKITTHTLQGMDEADSVYHAVSVAALLLMAANVAVAATVYVVKLLRRRG